MKEIEKINEQKNSTPIKYKTELEVFKDDYEICIKKMWKEDDYLTND